MHLIKKYTLASLLVALLINAQGLMAQEGTSSGKKVGFYFAPEYTAMFLENHVGNALSYDLGLNFLQGKLTVGIRFYGRSGPINEHAEFELVLQDGMTYKGKSVLQLGNDHGYFGLAVGYQESLLSDRLLLKGSLSFGQIGAGFYLKGEDRETPDGRRVSEWEDELMGDTDAGFGLLGELGVNVYYHPFESLPFLGLGGGLHFSKTFGYESFLGGNDFYDNKLRLALGLIIQRR